VASLLSSLSLSVASSLLSLSVASLLSSLSLSISRLCGRQCHQHHHCRYHNCHRHCYSHISLCCTIESAGGISLTSKFLVSKYIFSLPPVCIAVGFIDVDCGLRDGDVPLVIKILDSPACCSMDCDDNESDNDDDDDDSCPATAMPCSQVGLITVNATYNATCQFVSDTVTPISLLAVWKN